MSSNGGTSDFLLLQALMSRYQLRPPYLDTNSFLSQSLDDFLLPSDEDNDTDDDDDDDEEKSSERKHRKLIAKEEAKLEKEIITIIRSGNGREALKANSGQSVSIGDHNICVGVHDEESGSEYRVWEWHGHIMLFNEVDGYSPEYVYGNYFERFTEKTKTETKADKEKDEEESKVKGEGNSGLRNLIGVLSGGGGGRVVHRNSLNTAK